MNAAYELGMAAIGPPDMAFLSGGHRFNLFWDTDRLGEMGELVELAARSGYPTVKAFLPFSSTRPEGQTKRRPSSTTWSPQTSRPRLTTSAGSCTWHVAPGCVLALVVLTVFPDCGPSWNPFPSCSPWHPSAAGSWGRPPSFSASWPRPPATGRRPTLTSRRPPASTNASTRPPGWHAPGSNGPGCSWPVANRTTPSEPEPPAPGARDRPRARPCRSSSANRRAVSELEPADDRTRTAIVLFTDLVGSTELRSRLGEEAAETLRHRHDALVTAAIEASRGNGRQESRRRALWRPSPVPPMRSAAAVAIQQAIGRHNRSGAAALGVRIGISAGDVVFEEATASALR